MIKDRTYGILEIIHECYKLGEITQEKVDSWHIVLINHDYETVKSNLIKHIEQSTNAPRIADLLYAHSSSVVPSVEETAKNLNVDYTTAKEDVRKESLAKIQSILGIGGEEIE